MVEPGPEDSPHGMYRESPSRSRGRGRGRLHISELEMPLDNIPLEIFKKKISPVRSSGGGSSFTDDLQRPQKFTDVPSPFPQDNNKMLDMTRKIERVGESFKISISNSVASQSTPKPQRQVSENRGRFKSQPSYSSQSDEDIPRDRGSRGSRRPRSHKYQRGQGKPETSPVENIITGAMPAELSKPPLPPSKPKISEDEDGSWEDVTTSGTESLGEELLSTHTTPTKRTAESESTTVEPSDHQFDEYLKKVGVLLSDESSGSSIRALDKEDIVLDQSLEFGKENKSDECLSLEVSNTISSSDVSVDDKASSNPVGSFETSSENREITASSTNYIEEYFNIIKSEANPKAEESDKEEVKVCSEKTKTETSDVFNEEKFIDLSTDKTSLEKVEDTEPTKLLLDEENSAEEEIRPIDLSVNKTSLEIVKNIEPTKLPLNEEEPTKLPLNEEKPTKLPLNEENSAKEKQIISSSELNNGESLTPNNN